MVCEKSPRFVESRGGFEVTVENKKVKNDPKDDGVVKGHIS